MSIDPTAISEGINPLLYIAAGAAFVIGVLIGRATKKIPPPPPPPAAKPTELRINKFSLLWFPQLTLEEPYIKEVLVGLPHCPKCVVALKLQAGPPESWVCLNCQARHAGSVADLQVTDQVREQAVAEFLQRNKGWRLFKA